ncbi:cellulase family glycosylhydrolase [Stenotrophomonas sp. HITSZ_GD]|uniref:cellulase family glycosylhydrolase n=1 Tax=Stenotrophomonas sp. HITSZ_GD TaxID=3037248 RepID=UPI00240E001D|nr:cellulase family glycosylhydrolase [Stenotrophomonas sp. HITSZ_GD]MDG2525744.1 cellulase family glycosylhydrolase [Stenotrophomonas sp. HITSZ_GD]
MKSKTRLIALVLALAAVQAPATAKDFLRADGTRIVDGQGEPVILRGMGLGGWMLQEGYMLELPQFGTQRVIRQNIEKLIGPEKTQAFYTAWLDNHTTKADVDAMARWGFNSIRLPMHYALYTLPVEQEPVKGEQTWLEDGFRRTDELLAWAKANDMYLILDLHAAPGGQGNDINISDRDPAQSSLWDDPAKQEKMIALWRKLAERYKDEPYIGAYDIINEPNWGFSDRADRNGCKETGNAPLRDLLVRTTAAIREVDKRHIVIVEGNCWGNNYAGVFDEGMWDDNLVVSFHKYWDATTPDTLGKVIALRDKHHVPLWLGESGENSNDWFARTIQLVENEGIGWSWWPLKKIRYNNPLQVTPNEGYRRLLAYWEGKGPQPSAAEAEQALMQFASHDVRYENNVQHPDVVDALFRSPHSLQPVPYKTHRIGADGGTVAAIDFDMGRDGVAYHDLTASNDKGTGPDRVTWNPAMTYRNDGVDLGVRQDGTLQVAGLEKGEWLKYTVEVETGGRYTLALQGDGKGQAWVQVNGDRLAQTVAGANGKLPVTLAPGRNTLVVGAAAGKFDLRALRIEVAR